MEVETGGTEINETTAESVEPIAKGGGDTPTSFDDLQAVHAAADRKEQLSVDTAKEKAVEKAKSATTSKKTASKEAKEEVTSEDVDADGEEVPQELPDVRKFKAKNGHDEVELRADMEIPVTIDGEDTVVSLNDLRNGYAGQATIKQRLEQLGNDRSTYEADRASLDNFVGEVFKDVETDPMAAMIRIAERAGLDPVKYQMSLLDSLSEHAQNWSGMTEEERTIYRTDLENQQLKSRLERSESQNSVTQQRAEMDNRVTELQADLGIDRESFAENYFEVAEYFESEGLDANEISPEIVAQYIVDKHNETEASEILKSVNPELGEDWDAVNTLMGVAADNPEMTDEDLREIAMEVWGTDKKAEKVSRKVAKGKPDIVNDTVSRNADKTPLTFDELEQMI